MGWKYFFVLFSTLCSLCFSQKKELEPIRSNISACALYLLYDEGKDDSLGQKVVSSLHPDELKTGLKAYLTANGQDSLKGKHLYVTGVEMGSEKNTTQRLRQILEEIGVSQNSVTVTALSIPRKRVDGLWRSLWDRVIYFFPSLKKDYQSPMREEVVSGIVSSALVEAPNVVYLLTTLPTPDAQLTLGTHAALLTLYSVYKKFLVNWILRSNGNVEIFLKQMLLAFPFVLNYNLFSNFSAIQAYASTYGADGVLGRLPEEVTRFGLTQGLTTFLQTLFYSWVISKGFRQWENNQTTPEKAELARSASNYLMVPWLWADAVFLTMASTAATVIYQAGDFGLNTGHIALATLTVGGSAIVLKPKILDYTLEWYQAARTWASSVYKKIKSWVRPPPR